MTTLKIHNPIGITPQTCFNAYERVYQMSNINAYLLRLDILFFENKVINPCYEQAKLRGCLPEAGRDVDAREIFSFWEITLTNRYASFCRDSGVDVEFCKLSSADAHLLYESVTGKIV